MPRPPGHRGMMGQFQPIKDSETKLGPMRGLKTEPAQPDIGIQPRLLVLPEILTEPSHLNTIRYIWG